MPRDSAGVMTLPIAVFVTGTAISATDMNTLIEDLRAEIQDSLSRSGEGGMLVAFKLADGTVALPAFAFNSEPSSGWYRASAGNVRLSILGVDAVTVTAGTLGVAAIDRTGALNIGITNTTGIQIGRVGQNVTMPGTLDALDIDRGGVIGLGNVFASTITIGRSGQSLVVNSEPSGPYTWRRVVATADTSNSDSAVATDIAGLSFSVATATKYLVRAKLFTYSAATTTGLGVSPKSTGAPTTSTLFWVFTHTLGSPPLSSDIIRGAVFLDLPITGASVATASATQPQVETFDAYFVTTSTGTFQLRLVTEVNASAVTVKAGSYLEWMAFT